MQEGDPGWVGSEVRILGLDATGDPVRVCAVRLEQGVAVCQPPRFPEWDEQGIVGRAEAGRLFPRDGQRFLDELPYAYRSAYLWAEKA